MNNEFPFPYSSTSSSSAACTPDRGRRNFDILNRPRPKSQCSNTDSQSRTSTPESVISSSKSSSGSTSSTKGTRSKYLNIGRYIDVISDKEKHNIEEKLSNFMFGCNIPFSVVESRHFKAFVKALRPAYEPLLPSRKTLSSRCLDEAYERCTDIV